MIKSLEERYLEAGLPTIEGGLQFSRELTAAEQQLVTSIKVDLVEQLRVKAINEEADERVAEITGDQAQINRDIVLALGLMYNELRPQLSANTVAIIDPIAAKSVSASAVRAKEAAMIANPELTWD